MPITEAALRLGVSRDKVYEIIRSEHDAQMPDELRMIPGGRCHVGTFKVFRHIFDAVLSGKAITAQPEPFSVVRKFGNDLKHSE